MVHLDWIYLCIYIVFKLQKAMKIKTGTKNPGTFVVRIRTAKDIWSLCRAHTHGKDTAPAGVGCAWRGLCRAGRREAHGKELAVAVRGRGEAHGKD